MCRCGYPQDEHSDDACQQTGGSATWDIEQNTELVKTDAYGKIQFRSLDFSKPPIAEASTTSSATVAKVHSDWTTTTGTYISHVHWTLSW